MSAKKEDGMSRETLVEKTQTKIKDLIINKEYDGNNYLPNEGELCRKFGVSRVTVREAVRSMEVRGFLRRVHGKGILVVDNRVEVMTRFMDDMLSMNFSDMLQLVEMRTVIEIETVRMAALRAKRVDLDEIERFLGIMENSENMDDGYYAADLDFHIALGKASQNNFLYTIIHAYTPLLKSVIIASSQLNYSIERKYHFHRNIYDSVASGDAEGAMEKMRVHLKATESNILNERLKDH